MSEKKLPMPTVEDDRCGHLGKECSGDLPVTVCAQFFCAYHFAGSSHLSHFSGPANPAFQGRSRLMETFWARAGQRMCQ